MLPLSRQDGHLLAGVCQDSRPPPQEFSEFFSYMAHVAHSLGAVSEKVGGERLSELANYAGGWIRDMHNRDLHQQFIAYTKLSEAMKNPQVFEFGEIQEKHLIEEAKLGGSLMCDGLLQPPYDAAIYWYTLTGLVNAYPPEDIVFKTTRVNPELQKVRYATLLVTEGKGKDAEYLVADFMVLDPETAYAFRQSAQRGLSGTAKAELEHGKHILLCSAVAWIIGGRDGRWKGVLLDRVGLGEDVDDQHEQSRSRASIGSLADGLAAFSMLLTTKHVPVRHEPAPVKLNVKRERQGKPPYPSITSIDARAYFDAMQRTALGGTHASPVPHLRRGHRRQYSDGRQTWVRSCLVNCRSLDEAQARDHYEVVT